jgi:hypothetical protein
MFTLGSPNHHCSSSLIKAEASKIFRQEEMLNSQNQYFSNRRGAMSTGRNDLNPNSTLAFTGAWKNDRARDV